MVTEVRAANAQEVRLCATRGCVLQAAQLVPASGSPVTRLQQGRQLCRLQWECFNMLLRLTSGGAAQARTAPAGSVRGQHIGYSKGCVEDHAMHSVPTNQGLQPFEQYHQGPPSQQQAHCWSLSQETPASFRAVLPLRGVHAAAGSAR